MYGRMVSAITGSSSGAKALGMLGPLAKRVTKSAGNASVDMAIRAGGSSGLKRSMYVAGAKTASAVARHPMRTIGATGLGAGAAGYGAMRRRGSQNYPMY